MQVRPTDNHYNNQTTKSIQFGFFESLLIWLSGADKEQLKSACPGDGKRPVFFGMIAASYAVSTLTENWWIIIGFALVWGFIILAIDRVLLSTYRDRCLLSLGQEQNVDYLTRMKFRADMCHELTHYQPSQIKLDDFVPFGLESHPSADGLEKHTA